MNLLLDIHTLIWLFEGDENLSKNVRIHIENPENTNFISIATFWEIAIKRSINKLEMNMSIKDLQRLVWEKGIEILPIKVAHSLVVSKLPFHHKDPFDRMIISQAISENMNLLSCDEIFDNYLTDKLIKRFW